MAKRVAEFLKVSFEQFAEGYRDSSENVMRS